MPEQGKARASKTYTVADIIALMDAWAPPAYAYEWDRIGLSTGSPQSEVRRVLACLSVTGSVLAEALEWGAQMVVSHHPLIWEPLRSIRTDDSHTRLCLEFAQHGIASFSAHTNLDIVPGGVNDVLAAQLGLEEAEVLLPVKQSGQLKLVTFVPETHLPGVRDALAAAGAGVIGNYTHCSFFTPGTGTFLPGEGAAPFSGQKGVVNEEAELRLEMLVSKARLGQALQALHAAHPYEEPAYDLVLLENRENIGLGRLGALKKSMTLQEFAEKAAGDLQGEAVRFVGDPRLEVRRVAVIGGSGGDFVAEVAGRADVLLTGDVKYHHAQEALERGLAVIDAGHCATEKAIAPAIVQHLLERLPGLEGRAVLEGELFQTVQLKRGH